MSCALSLDCFVCAGCGTVLLCFGDLGFLCGVVVGGTTSGIRASQVSLGIFLEIRRALGADLVEIVCRSQISCSLVRGIMCRSQNNARSTQGIIGGVDPVRNSI